MNKQQTKKLLKYILIALGVILLIANIVANNFQEQVQKESKELMEKTGMHESMLLSLGLYDSLFMAGLKIKYPSNYTIQKTDTASNSYGICTLIQPSDQSELNINYSSKLYPLGDSTNKSTPRFLALTVTDFLKISRNIYENHLKKKYNITTITSDIKTREIKNHQIKYLVIKYRDKEFYIYAIQTDNYIFGFSSYKIYLLDGIIENIKLQ